MMYEHPIDAVMTEGPVIDRSAEENLQRINAGYQELAKKYSLPMTNAEEALKPLPLQPAKIDSKTINNDLKQLMVLYDENLKIDSHEAITPTPAQIFLTQPVLFNTLSSKNLTQLMLRNETAKSDSYNVLNQIDTHTYSKASLQESFSCLAMERKQSTNKSPEKDLILINFLLSVPRHAALFTWQEVLDIFKTQDNSAPLIPFTLAINFENIGSGCKALINQLTLDNAAPYLLAMKDLNEAALNGLLPEDKDKQTFFNLLTDKKLSMIIVNHWQPATIKWAINQICHLAVDLHTSEDEAESTLLPKHSLLHHLLVGLFDKKPAIFLNQIKNTQLPTHIKQDTLETCLTLPRTSDNETTKSALLTALISMGSFLSTLSAPLILCLCKQADTEQFQTLLENDNVRQQLATSKDGPHSAIYCLFSESSDLKDSQSKYLQSNPYDLLDALSSAEILDLANKPADKVLLSLENVTSLVNKRSLNAEGGQEHLNTTMLKCRSSDEKTTLTKGLFNVLMKHNDYQEAWLRSEIFSPKWETLGQGFFSKKVPATIEKARRFLDAAGNKNTNPLAKEDLKTLVDFFKTTKNTSHNYWYFWGSYNLRDEATQNFYSKVDELPAANAPHNMM